MRAAPTESEERGAGALPTFEHDTEEPMSQSASYSGFSTFWCSM